MPISQVEFSKLEEETSQTNKTPLNYLAPDTGKAYVIAISRDGCPACQKQKPQLENLAKRLARKYADKVVFSRIHIRHSDGSEEESLRSKAVLGHYFYPTNLILFRTSDRGAIEFYKNASPTMEELEKNIEKSVDIVKMIESTA